VYGNCSDYCVTDNADTYSSYSYSGYRAGGSSAAIVGDALIASVTDDFTIEQAVLSCYGGCDTRQICRSPMTYDECVDRCYNDINDHTVTWFEDDRYASTLHCSQVHSYLPSMDSSPYNGIGGHAT
jgi:hypothetical protein